MKILVIIPAYNEESSIAKVVKEVCMLNQNYNVIVVDDGSTDRTYEEARNADARVLQLPINLGIGGAMQTGFHYAVRNGYDCVLQVDGDGQHPAHEIPKLVEIIERDDADVVIGSRFLQKQGFQSTFSRRIGIWYFTSLHRSLTRVHITDSTSGFRALNCKALKVVDAYYPDEYPEAESIVLFALNNLRVREVPVVMRERQGGESSIKRLTGLYYMFKVTLAIVFTYLRLKNRRK